jgi:hypothetical protein
MEPSGVPLTSREAPTVIGCGECAFLLNYGTRWSEFKVGLSRIIHGEFKTFKPFKRFKTF